MKHCLLALALLLPNIAAADVKTTDDVLFSASCISALKAAIARDDSNDAIYSDDEKEVAYAFIRGLGAKDPRPGDAKEVFGRGVGAVAFFCERNPDVTLFEIGRILGRE